MRRANDTLGTRMSRRATLEILPALALALAPVVLVGSIAHTGEAHAQAELFAVAVNDGGQVGDGDGQDPDLRLEREEIRVTIDRQHAHTRMRQVFANMSQERLEGRYHLQVGEGAHVSGFAYWNGEQKIVGEVFEKETAARVYEQVTGLGRDPGLLERAGEGAFSFRIFPIEAGERKPVEVMWNQWLRREGNTVEYRVPLTPEHGRIDIDIADERPIVEVTSATHDMELSGLGSTAVRVRASGQDGQAELVLRYRVRGDDWRLSAYMHRDPGHDGYMLLTLAAPPGLAEDDVEDKDITLVIDRSGSMSGVPLERAKLAAQAVIDRLRPSDRVNVLVFDDDVDLLYPTPRLASDSRRTEAKAYIAAVGSGGGTNLALALERALAAQAPESAALAMAPEKNSASAAMPLARPHVILFLTDGQSDAQRTLAVAEADQGDARVFTIGVGDGVEKPLLSRLAAMKRGRFTFIESPSAIESKVSRLYGQIAAPVLVGLSLDVAENNAGQRTGTSIRLQRRYPRTLPDLYRHDELVIAARFAGTGPVNVRLRGQRGGQPVIFERTIDMPASARRPWVGTMWAQARVQDLLEEIALYGEGEELRDEVVNLAVAYNFVTDYTSFLAIPESEITDEAREMLASARERKAQILAAHKDAVALSRQAMPPGDPILKVRAPASARQVTAYFPFGLVKDLTYDADTEHWRVRFLVPKDVADGDYMVKIVIVHADGTVEVAQIPYTIDSDGPEFEVQTQEVEGGVLLTVETAEDVRLVTAAIADGLAPGRRFELQDQGDGRHYSAILPLSPGRHRLRVVVADMARNEADELIDFDVLEQH